MEDCILFAVFSAIIFVFFKIIEMKYLEKEFKPLKFVFRDAIMVFVSSFLGAALFLYSNHSIKHFLNFVTENKTMNIETAQVFTDSPGF